MTIYRAWPDMGSLLGDLMTREWVGVAAATNAAAPDTHSPAGIAAAGVATIRALRDNELFVRIVELDPELLLPYLLDRPGRSQRLVVDVIAEQIRAGQATGEVRPGDPTLLARSIVLACHGFTLSAQTMTGGKVTAARLDDELATLLEGYLRP